jgi:hypothetical protein
MSSARRPLPTDLVALVSFDGRVYPNEAKPLDRIGLNERAKPLEEALEQWFSFATGKHTWVSVRGATIRGLISARQRAKRSAWEVEVLIDASDDDSVALSLFSRMAAGVARQGAERVFLRLSADSGLRDNARRSGFFQYSTETLFHWTGGEAPAEQDLPLRSRGKADVPGLFHLYTQTVPANVRAIEGMTLREWQAAQERWGGRTTDLIADGEDGPAAWLRVASANGIARLYAMADATVPADALVSAGLVLVPGREVFALVPDYNAALGSALLRAGLKPEGQYISLAKRLTKMVGELAKEPAKEAVPAG